MENIGISPAMWVIPIVVIGLVAVVVLMIRTVVRNYFTVPPNEVHVVSGRKHKHVQEEEDGTETVIVRGYRIITGGGYLRIPVLESVQHMFLSNMSVPVGVRNVPDKNGALVTVAGIAQIKIKSDLNSLARAIERFLGYSKDQVAAVGKDTLEGNLRSIVGTMTIEELIKDRSTLQTKILGEAGTDLDKMGINIDLLTLQEISDDRDYITSLGKTQTAQVVRDARVGEADATREGDVLSAAAREEGEIAKAKAEENISIGERERDVTKAKNEATVQAEQARIPIRASQAVAEEQKVLNIAEIEAEKAKAEASVSLEEAEQRRNEAHLEATVVTEARKQGEAKVVLADANRSAATLDGEALRIKQSKEGEGQKDRDTAIAEGRKATAAAEEAELKAQASGKEAGLLADAAGKQAMLLAEAEGVLKKAEAFKQLDEAGRFLLILEAMPPVIEALGGAVKEFMVPVAEAIGQGLANVDEIRLVDLGGSNNGTGTNMLSRFAHMPIETILDIANKVKASGMAPAVIELAKAAGFDAESIFAQATVKEVSPSEESQTDETEVTVKPLEQDEDESETLDDEEVFEEEAEIPIDGDDSDDNA